MVYVWDFDILNLLVIFLNSRFSFNFIRIKKIWFEIGMVNLSGLFIFCIIFKIDLKVFKGSFVYSKDKESDVMLVEVKRIWRVL